MTDSTPTPPELDLATLRVITEGATEGPWRIYTVTDSGGRSAAVETAWAHDKQGEDTELVTDWCSPEDAAHIAAFDPPTVLAMIAELEHERKGLTEAIEWVAQEKARSESAVVLMGRFEKRAIAAEAKIAAVRASVLPYYEADGHACDDLDEYCARCVADEVMDALDGQECPDCAHPHSVTRCGGAMCDCCEAIAALDGTA